MNPLRKKENNSIQSSLKQTNKPRHNTKKVKYLYNENYRALEKHLKKTLKIEKTFHVHGLAELMLLNGHINKVNVRLNVIPIKIFHGTRKTLKLIWRSKDTEYAKQLGIKSTILDISQYQISNYTML